MTTDDATIEADGTEGAGFDALDALTAIGAVGDEPERAHARGPEAVRHVVMGWATRALGAERRASAQAAALEALRAEVDAVRALVGPHLPLPDAVRQYAGVRPTPYGLAHPTPDGKPSEHDSPTARLMNAIAAAARATGVAIKGAYASEEDAIALLQRIVARTTSGAAQATEERWATVELMGHTTAAGLVREEDALGGRVLVLRALRPDGSYDERRLMPAAVYGWRYVTEDEARRATLPRWGYPCGAHEDAGACPGWCARCGRTRAEHEARAAEDARAEGEGAGDEDREEEVENGDDASTF